MSTEAIITPREQKSINKKLLRQYKDKPIKFGQNSLQVINIAEKFVTISENQRGLAHQHKRHNIFMAPFYIEYKKSILSQHNENEIDTSRQSPAYKQQLHNINQIKESLSADIRQVYLKSNCKMLYNLVIHANEIVINLETGDTISIYLRSNNDTWSLAIANTCNLSHISVDINYDKLKFLNELCDLIVKTTTNHTSIAFLSEFKLLNLSIRQLDSLATWVHVEEKSSCQIENKIKKYIGDSLVGDEHEISIGTHEFNGVIFLRTMTIKKVTRIRTIIEVVSTSDDCSIIEYRTTINKITHAINDNSQKIVKLLNQLK